MYKPLNFFFVAVALLACSRLDAAVLPDTPDAGSIMRSQTPQRELPGTLPSPEEHAPVVTTNGNGEIQVTVTSFRFQGYEGLTTEAVLQSIVAGYVGKTLDMNALQDALDKVTAHLKSMGWFLAEAYLPEQDLVGGVVRIAIIQGKSDGNIRIKLNKSVRICDTTLEKFALKGATPGEPLNRGRLEQSLLHINALPGIHARSMVAPGSVSESSIVTFDVTEGALVSGNVSSDDTGNSYTGAWRGNALVLMNDPLRCGDQLSILYGHSAGLNQGRIGYSFPIGGSGVRGILSWAGMNYKLLQELEALGYTGESSIVEVGLNWPIVRNRKTTLSAGIGYTARHLTDRNKSTGLHDKTVKEGNVNLSLLNYDKWLGGGATSVNFAVNFGNFYQPAIYDTPPGVMGYFSYLNASFNRLQKVSSRVNLNLSCSSLYAFGNLDSSEKLYLGGPYGVRAWPVGEAGGDSGQLLNVDLRYQLPAPSAWGKVQLGGFYDAGHVELNHSRFVGDVNSATGRNEYWLEGAGVNLNWELSKSCAVECSWAHAIGENPGRNNLGKDADGKSDNSRFWLQGTVKF